MTCSAAASKEKFQARESPLTTAFAQKTVVQGLFWAWILICVVTYAIVAVNYAYNPAQLREDIDFVRLAFSNLSVFAVQWVILMSVISFVAYPAAKRRLESRDAGSVTHASQVSMAVMVIVTVPLYTIYALKLHMVLRLATVIEQLRLLMKMISFLVECERKRKRLQAAHKTERTEDPTTLRSLLYFLFAPTMIYRDAYPRASKPTNWLVVCSYAVQFVAIALFNVVIVNQHLSPRLRVIGSRPLSRDELLALGIRSVGFIFYLLLEIGYGFFHCWCNIFAEVMGFGDRMFYKDWLSAINIMDFMRTWNYVTHAWIAEYLFKPLLRWSGSRWTSICLVMTVAGLAHDYIINVCFGILLLFETSWVPFLILMAVWTKMKQGKREPSVEKTRNRRKRGFTLSVFVLLLIINICEFGSIVTEYHATRNCPRPDHGWRSSVLAPHFFSCGSFVSFDSEAQALFPN